MRLSKICQFEVEEEIHPQHCAFTARENKCFHFALFIAHSEPAVLSGMMWLGAFTQGNPQLHQLGNRSWPQSQNHFWPVGSGGWEQPVEHQ